MTTTTKTTTTPRRYNRDDFRYAVYRLELWTVKGRDVGTIAKRLRVALLERSARDFKADQLRCACRAIGCPTARRKVTMLDNLIHWLGYYLPADPAPAITINDATDDEPAEPIVRRAGDCGTVDREADYQAFLAHHGVSDPREIDWSRVGTPADAGDVLTEGECSDASATWFGAAGLDGAAGLL